MVRHGQSTWNRERRIQGQLDPPLSDEGRLQADRLSRRLGLPEEVAQSVLMVVGNAYMTGQTIQVNGGMHFN